ncbi:pentatricopeptide repeat-containing protein At1g74600, chloroplastic [Selaginella moellendorffii]|uniref:pentatricopeptide repeat-containing protein At1g74600, chloroplastic n=1 Tax=Selaginella moellendorffii TaxID=88036 RepID=UPI000D1C34F0|nr:pentatricopeptide repeat-containing protein At1g74600, chloroplastic [Selaginella moellendorffii]|eukprot:XP_024543129.1 pentatricopeptide repeat-containing protein At1g74600, chloroplastic [Selaginella moellendorffii]
MDVEPNEMVIVSTLAACSGAKDLALGMAIHARILSPDLRKSVFVGTALLNMYAKCGAIEQARAVFDQMPHKDVVSWTAMITAFAQMGDCRQALETLEGMIQARVQPNPVTFVAAITACSSREFLDRGRKIHAAVIDLGLHGDITIQNALVSMYAKGSSAEEALSVFQRMEDRNRVSWNSMIAAFAASAQSCSAMGLFHGMNLEGIKPDDVSFLGVLSACSSTGCLRSCKRIHSQLELAAVHSPPDLSVENSLVTAYAKCGDLEAAERIFQRIPGKNVVSWTAMLTAYTFHGNGSKALELYDKMVGQSIQPDSVVLLNVIYAGSLVGDVGLARKLHARVASSSFMLKIQIQNALINMYARCGSLEEARRVFDGIERKNLVSWNAMMGSYVQHGYDEEAIALFSEMKTGNSKAMESGLRSSVSASSDSSLYTKSVKSSDSTNTSASTISDSILKPDCIMAVILLCAHAGLGKLAEGRCIHAELCAVNPEILAGSTTNVTLGNALVSMYARCGSMGDASAAFHHMRARDTVTWSSLVAGYAHHGHAEYAILLYRDMHLEGVQPDSVTYVSILNSCSHAGLLAQARHFFVSMVEDHCLAAWPDHWKCMVDVLGRAGFVGRAEDVVRNMPFQPDVVAWNTLLGCCKVHGDAQRGAVAARNAVGISPGFAGSTVLLCMRRLGGTSACRA